MKARHKIVRVAGGRVAVTNTSTIPDDELRHAIRWLARHVDLNGVVVHAKKHGRRRTSLGMAYDGIPYMANLTGLRPWEWDYLITLTDHPNWFRTLAHEAKHVEQFRDGTPPTERRANAFAAGIELKWLESRTAPVRAAQPASPSSL